MVNDVRFSFNEHRHRKAVARAFKEDDVKELGINGLCEAPAARTIGRPTAAEAMQAEVDRAAPADEDEEIHFVTYDISSGKISDYGV
ncbi:MAG: hypothetical protein EPN47_15620, partial [Acidobacteria bacterium]